MQGVGAKQDAARPTNNLYGLGLFGIRLEQLVYITEPGSTHWNSILGHLVSAATACTGQYRGADAQQGLLPVTPVEYDTRDSIQYFTDVNLFESVQQFPVHCMDAGRDIPDS